MLLHLSTLGEEFKEGIGKGRELRGKREREEGRLVLQLMASSRQVQTLNEGHQEQMFPMTFGQQTSVISTAMGPLVVWTGSTLRLMIPRNFPQLPLLKQRPTDK